jgi:hypothetical protein
MLSHLHAADGGWTQGAEGGRARDWLEHSASAAMLTAGESATIWQSLNPQQAAREWDEGARSRRGPRCRL